MELPGREASSFTDLLRHRAAEHPERRAYVFLRDGEAEENALTFGELEQRALAITGHLSACSKPGDRVILLYPSGLDFIVTFYGCLGAGVIPVPVSVPNRHRGFEILRGIASDSGASCILTVTSLLSKLRQQLASEPELGKLTWLCTDQWTWATSNAPRDFAPRLPHEIALLQYTSGSTGSPRGVVVTHGNLFDNQRQIQHSFRLNASSSILSWLPMFHDMGLGTVLQAIWTGVPCVLMAPTAFLQKPVRWLRAISRYRATSSGGPDFAYDLCARRIPKEDCAGLDLSCWDSAYNGSEPVRASTLARFDEAFAPYGFRRTAFYPVYGLAEATLFVSGAHERREPIIGNFSVDALERGEGVLETGSRGKMLIGCGSEWLDGRIRVVHPETLEPCPSGQIGEIWVAGPSVAAGYWQKPVETQEVFQARTVTGEGPFLRTGDLGFQHSGNLFVTGRHKDLIIIRGRNHYPQDIESSVAESHPALEPSTGAAFSVEGEDGEQLVIVQEVKRTAVHRLDAEAIFRAIRSAVANDHGVHAHTIVLLSPGNLPRTTSGKVRRKACRQAFLNQTLSSLAASVFGAETLESNGTSSSIAEGGVPAIGERRVRTSSPLLEIRAAKAADAVIEWLRSYAQGAHEPTGSDVLHTLTPSLLLDLAKQGLLGMQVDEEYGGLGLGHGDTVRVLEQLAAIDLNAGLFVGLNNYLGVSPVAKHGTDSLKRSLLPRLTRGGDLAGFAFAEPGIGSNPTALAAYAEPINGSGWRLFGNKHQSGGSIGENGVINVFTRHSARSGVSAFVVPRAAPGSTYSTTSLESSSRGLAGSLLVLDGVALKNEQVLGRIGEGLEIAREAMSHARLAIAAACLGGMKRCAQLVFYYSTQRQTATGRLVAHPVTLARLGRVTAGIAALECLIQQIARRADSDQDVPSEAFTVCKAVAPEMLWQAVDDLVQLLGRRGFSETPHIARLVRDAQALRCHEGPSEVTLSLLGARLLSSGAASVSRLATDVLKSPNAGTLVERAVEAASARLTKSSSLPSDDAAYWTNARAGEVVTWIALLAAVEGRLSTAPTGDLQRAQKWAEANVERTLNLLQSDLPPEMGDQEEGLTESIVAYSRAIGGSDPVLLWGERTLNPLLSGDLGEPPPPSSRATKQTASSPVRSSHDDKHGAGLQSWIVTWLSKRLRVAESQIEPKRSFADHGVDSLAAVELAKALSDHLGRSLDETLLWNFATIDALVQFLDGRGSPSAPPPRASQTPPAARASKASDREVTQEDLAEAIARLEEELKRRS